MLVPRLEDGIRVEAGAVVGTVVFEASERSEAVRLQVLGEGTLRGRAPGEPRPRQLGDALLRELPPTERRRGSREALARRAEPAGAACARALNLRVPALEMLDPLALNPFAAGSGSGLLPRAWVGPLLWLVIYPLGELAARASRAAYKAADALARARTGRELSAPFGPAAGDELTLPDFALRWLGVGGVLYVLGRVIVGLAAQLAQELPIGTLLRLSFGVFLFGNLMVISQRLRNVWFFRRLAQRPQSFDLVQRQEPAMLYWTGLATYLQAAWLLFAAWIVSPSAWLLGGVVGTLLWARRYRRSLLELRAEDEASDQGAS